MLVSTWITSFGLQISSNRRPVFRRPAATDHKETRDQADQRWEIAHRLIVLFAIMKDISFVSMAMLSFISFDSASALNPSFRNSHPPRQTLQIRHSNKSSSNMYQSSENEESCTACRRISSRDASALIEKQYSSKQSNFLLITSDASGGSGRFHGLCAILRLLNGHDDSYDSVSIAARRTRAVQQCTGKRKSRTRRSSRDRKIGAGRVLGLPSEISAVSLGLRTALDVI